MEFNPNSRHSAEELLKNQCFDSFRNAALENEAKSKLYLDETAMSVPEFRDLIINEYNKIK